MQPDLYLTTLRRRWRVIAFTILTAVVVTFVVTPAHPKGPPKRYVAQHRLILSSPATGNDRSGGALQPNALPAAAELATGAEVTQRVAARVGYQGDSAKLASQIKVEANPDTRTITISSTQSKPAQAEQLADAFATELLVELDSRQLSQQQQLVDATNKRIQTIQTQVTQLEARIAKTPLAGQAALIAQRDALLREYGQAYAELQLISGTPTSGLSSLETAHAKLAPASRFRAPTSRLGRIALAAALGLLLGLALALIVQRFDLRIGTKEVAEAAFGAPVLSDVPILPLRLRRRPEVLTAVDPSSMIAEAYRTLRTSLVLMRPHPQASHSSGNGEHVTSHTPAIEVSDLMILVSSANPGEGKTTTAVNLAASFAEAGRSVLVLDCDFRHPRAQRYLGVSDSPGLSDAILAAHSGSPMNLEKLARSTSVPGVRLITAGQSVDRPSELFPLATELVAGARRLADVVILDTAPILAINDALDVVPIVDQVVLVARGGKTSYPSAELAAERLRRVGAPLQGVVLVGGADAPAAHGYYYYYYSSGRSRGLAGFFRRRRRPDTASRPTRPRPEGAAANRPPSSGGGQGGKKRKQKGGSRPQQGRPAVATLPAEPPAAAPAAAKVAAAPQPAGPKPVPQQQQNVQQQRPTPPAPATPQPAPQAAPPAPQPQPPRPPAATVAARPQQQQPAPPPRAEPSPFSPPPPAAEGPVAAPETVSLDDPEDVIADVAVDAAIPSAPPFGPSDR
ncbi:MAG: hypothetical protein QOE35_1784 [Actinomycetota bacterium]